jgi:hypothetical protein
MFCRSCGAPWTPGGRRCPECGELHAETETRMAGPALDGEDAAPPAAVPPPVTAGDAKPDGLLPGRPPEDEHLPAEDLLRTAGPWILAGALALFVIGAAVVTIAFFGSGTGSVQAQVTSSPLDLPPTRFAPASGAPRLNTPQSTAGMSGLATPANAMPTRRPAAQPTSRASSTRQSDRLVTPGTGDVTPDLAARVERWLTASTKARADIQAATARISCGRDNTAAGRSIADVISQRQAVQRSARAARRAQPAGGAAALLRAMERVQAVSVTANRAYLAAATDPADCRRHLDDGNRISRDDVTPVKNAFLALWEPWAMQYDMSPGDRDSI